MRVLSNTRNLGPVDNTNTWSPLDDTEDSIPLPSPMLISLILDPSVSRTKLFLVDRVSKLWAEGNQVTQFPPDATAGEKKQQP